MLGAQPQLDLLAGKRIVLDVDLDIKPLIVEADADKINQVLTSIVENAIQAMPDGGHIAIEVDDVYHATERIKAQGCKILRDPGPMNAGSTIIAFVEDPDGYPIELIGVR